MQYSFSEPGQIVITVELSLDEARALLDIVTAACNAPEGAPCFGGALRVALLDVVECTADRLRATATSLAAEIEHRREGGAA